MDFYSPFSPPFRPLSLSSHGFSSFFGNHIETPYVPPLSQAPDVCNGNSRHRGKKLPRPDGRRGRNGFGRWGKKGWHTQGLRGTQQPSITSLFTDFSAGRHVDICNYRTEAAARGSRSFYSRSERRFLISSNEAPHTGPAAVDIRY